MCYLLAKANKPFSDGELKKIKNKNEIMFDIEDLQLFGIIFVIRVEVLNFGINNL